MHGIILVAGEDPIGQMIKTDPDGKDWTRTESTATSVGPADDYGLVHGDDFYAIGGRYSGQLRLVPGATSGKIYGDAMSTSEVRSMSSLPVIECPEDGEPGVTARPGKVEGTGYDQARFGDIDAEATMAELEPFPMGVVVNGVRHGIPPVEDFRVLTFLYASADSRELDPDEVIAEFPDETRGHVKALHDKYTELIKSWRLEFADIMDDLDPAAILTVVDVHR